MFIFYLLPLLTLGIYNFIKLYCPLCIYCSLTLLLNFFFLFICGLFLYLSISFLHILLKSLFLLVGTFNVWSIFLFLNCLHTFLS